MRTLQLGCPPPLHTQTLARGPLATVQLHPAVDSGTARAAVRRRRWLCCERGRTPAASRRLPGQQQLQAPPTATQPPSFGIQAKSGVPLRVFQLSGPAGPAAPQVRHPYPPLCHGAAHQELVALQGPVSALHLHEVRGAAPASPPPATQGEKFCSECGAESAPAGLWLPAAGGDRAWEVRTGSGPMWMCGDIFAAEWLWRGRLLTTGHLSCLHPIVVCAGRGRKLAVAGQSVAWACSGRCAAICVQVFSSVSHL